MRDRPGRGPHEEERLSALLDDELTDDDALVVTRHLAACPGCMAELEEIRAARQALRGLPGLAPPPLVLRQAVAAAGFGVLRARRTRRTVAAAAASAGIVAGVVFVLGAEQPGTVVPPVDVYVADHVARSGGGSPMITPVTFGTDGP